MGCGSSKSKNTTATADGTDASKAAVESSAAESPTAKPATAGAESTDTGTNTANTSGTSATSVTINEDKNTTTGIAGGGSGDQTNQNQNQGLTFETTTTGASGTTRRRTIGTQVISPGARKTLNGRMSIAPGANRKSMSVARKSVVSGKTNASAPNAESNTNLMVGSDPDRHSEASDDNANKGPGDDNEDEDLEFPEMENLVRQNSSKLKDDDEIVEVLQEVVEKTEENKDDIEIGEDGESAMPLMNQVYDAEKKRGTIVMTHIVEKELIVEDEEVEEGGGE